MAMVGPRCELVYGQLLEVASTKGTMNLKYS